MSVQYDRTFNVDNYKIYSKCSSQRKSVTFTVWNRITGFVYAAEWRYDNTPWLNGSQVYQFIKNNKGRSIIITNSDPEILVFEIYEYELKLKKTGIVKKQQNNDQQKPFIFHAKICKNLFINQRSFQKSFPYNRIGLIYGYSDPEYIVGDQNLSLEKEFTIGTGSLISRRVVLTCAHNVFDKQKNQYRKNLKFRLKFQNLRIVYIQVPQQYIYAKTWKQLKEYDFAILTLERQVASQQIYYRCLQICYDYEQPCKAIIIGFSFQQKKITSSSSQQTVKDKHKHKNKNKNTAINSQRKQLSQVKQTGAIDYVGWIDEGFALYDIRTDHGQSGSPVITKIKGQQKIIAIHIGYSKDNNRNMAVHLNAKVMDQIYIWTNLLKDCFGIKKISAISTKDFKNQLSKTQRKKLKKNSRKMIKGKKARSTKESKQLLLNGKKRFYDQNYQGAISDYNKAESKCKQNQQQEKVNIYAQLALTHRIWQTIIDSSKRNNRWSILFRHPHLAHIQLSNKQIKIVLKQNSLHSKKNISNLQNIGSFKEAQRYILQAIKIVTHLQQQNNQKLQNNTHLLTKYIDKDYYITQPNQDIQDQPFPRKDKNQKQIKSILTYLELQNQVLHHQKKKFTLKQILLKIEAGNVYVALKNLKKAEQIFTQLQTQIYPLATIPNKCQQIKYKYLLVSVYINLGLIYRKQDSSELQQDKDKANYTKKIQTEKCNQKAKNLEFELEQYGQNIQGLTTNEMYQSLLEQILLQLRQSNEIEQIEAHMFNIIILTLKFFRVSRQLNKLIIQRYLQIHSNLLQWFTFIYEMYQESQYIQKIKEILYQSILKSLQNFFFQVMSNEQIKQQSEKMMK